MQGNLRKSREKLRKHRTCKDEKRKDTLEKLEQIKKGANKRSH